VEHGYEKQARSGKEFGRYTLTGQQICRAIQFQLSTLQAHQISLALLLAAVMHRVALYHGRQLGSWF
jgi:hypothetical protein